MTTVRGTCETIASICGVSEGTVYHYALVLMKSGHLPKNSGRRYRHINLAQAHHIIAAVVFAKNKDDAPSTADAFAHRIGEFETCVLAGREYELVLPLGGACGASRSIQITKSGIAKLRHLFCENAEMAA